MKERIFIFVILQSFILSNISSAQNCADLTNIYSFNYAGKKYEIVKENKSWIDAAACAVERGGILADINSQQEQDTLYYHLQNAGIVVSNTVAPDGGGASYVWLGGNDIAEEGKWIWDGDNDGTGTHFWQGTSSGSSVGGLYNNWGNEPDNYNNNQDGLGLAITNWPLGSAGQWNDVKDTNTLYYIIEYANSTGILQSNTTIPRDYILHQNYPNPFNPLTTIRYNIQKSSNVILKVYNLTGQELETLVNGCQMTGEHEITWQPGGLPNGIYFYRLQAGEFSETKKLILQK